MNSFVKKEKCFLQKYKRVFNLRKELWGLFKLLEVILVLIWECIKVFLRLLLKKCINLDWFLLYKVDISYKGKLKIFIPGTIMGNHHG
jgi:hypothetical protein